MEDNFKLILNELKSINTRLDKVDSRLDKIDSRLDTIETRQKEDHEILKSLEHSAEVAKAERDNMTYDIAQIKGNVESINKELSRIEIATANNWSDIAMLKAARK